MKEKRQKNIRKNAGLTLVELIVTFALIGIFMVSATFVLSNSLRMFQRMESTSKAVTVSDLILDKISGEITAADVDRDGKDEGYFFWLGDGADDPNSAGSTWIAFGNRSKSPISIYQADGRLIIKYYGITDADKVGTTVKPVQEIDWKFDNNVYMGYQIESLTFSRPQPENHPNVVRIDLTLKHEKSGFTYSTYRYAENYNYDGTSTRLGMRSNSDGKSDWPSEAVEFTYPADWESTEPTGPTEPVEPTEPTEPVEPTEPTEPVEPTEPTEPIEPTGRLFTTVGENITIDYNKLENWEKPNVDKMALNIMQFFNSEEKWETVEQGGLMLDITEHFIIKD